MPDNYSVAIETGGYRLLELFAERCGDDAAVTITDGDGHQIASHAMPVAERRHRFLIPVPTSVCLTVRARQLTVRFAPDVYLEVQHPCWSCNSNSSSANASAGVR